MSVDVPAIDDLDGDGDWDIVTNTESSTSMYFYKSMQIENGDCSIPSLYAPIAVLGWFRRPLRVLICLSVINSIVSSMWQSQEGNGVIQAELY